MIRKFGKFFVFYIISCIVTVMLFAIALRFIGYHPAATIRNKISTRFRERQENVLISQTDAADENSYYEKTEAFGIFDNTPDHAFPATVIYKLVMDHFSSELPEGKTQKKLLFMGFDGYRTDALENILGSEESAILTVGEQGGIYYSFSGGVSGENEQDTSTDPTWTAMLTGGWGDYNGITRNGQMKNEQETFLTSLAKQGYSGTFNTGWQELLNVCFIPDIELSIRERLLIKYQYIADDMEMRPLAKKYSR